MYLYIYVYVCVCVCITHIYTLNDTAKYQCPNLTFGSKIILPIRINLWCHLKEQCNVVNVCYNQTR